MGHEIAQYDGSRKNYTTLEGETLRPECSQNQSKNELDSIKY